MKEMSRPCFSLDGGRTKFTDLIQMVEFYQVRKLASFYDRTNHELSEAMQI